MSQKMPEKKEGQTAPCSTCQQTLFCRMTTYPNYPNKLQWQYKTGGAHYDKEGFCKGFVISEEPDIHGEPDEAPEDEQKSKAKLCGECGGEHTLSECLKTKQTQIQAGQEAIQLSKAQADIVRQETKTILGIKKEITAFTNENHITIEDIEVGMITKLIYQTFFNNYKKASS